MTYSKAHQCFADRPNNQRALEHPEEFLGVNYKDVLNFWWYLECLSEEQWEIVRQRYRALGYEVRGAAWKAARDAAAAAYYAAAAARDAAWDAADAADAWAGAAAWNAAYDAVATGYATWELIGSHRLLEQGKSLTFLPLFLDL
jgi:hypothetical protein